MSVAANNQRMVVRLVLLVLFMGSMSFAAIPAYNWFCKVTGFAGVTNVAAKGSDVVLDQTIKVRFDASLNRAMPWEFRPMRREMELRLGETGLAYFEAYNPTDRVIAGSASFNVYPFSTGYYFNKIDCFCFEMQVLQPGERVLMPVSFYVDPDIVNDVEAKFAKHITLSYTFHETDLPDDMVSAIQKEQKDHDHSTHTHTN